MDFTAVSNVAKGTTAISASQARSWMGCRRKWGFEKAGYGRGFKKYFVTGTLVHAGLESFYMNESPIKGISETVKVLIEEHPSYEFVIKEEAKFAEQLLDNYLIFAAENDNFDVISLEEMYTYEANGRSIKFVIDGLVKDRDTGDYYIMEHKAPASFSKESLRVDAQITLYIALAEKVLGVKIAGAIYNQIKKKLPRTPSPLVKGGISAAAIDTTPEIYKQALIDFYGSVEAAPDANKSRLASLMCNGERFIKRDIIIKTEEEKDEIIKRFEDLWDEMMAFRDRVRLDDWEDPTIMLAGLVRCTPNPTVMNCGSCEYLDMCENTNKKLALPEPPKKVERITTTAMLDEIVDEGDEE